MSLHARVLDILLARVVARRPPDVVIGGEADPYLLRWHILPRNRWFNVYLHRFVRSDDDRALHDHPAANLSWLLDGSYVEHTIRAGGTHVRTPRKAGDWKGRFAKSAHRVELDNGPCWTLFLTGPRTRNWGFFCKDRWVPWQEFTAAKDGKPGEIGRGCGEAGQ